MDIFPGLDGGIQQYDAYANKVGYGWTVPILGNILAYPQSGFVEFGNCPYGDTFTLTVVDGETNKNVYTSGSITCDTTDGQYNYADFQVVDYTLKPGDILTVSHGTDSKELVITPEGTHT